MFDELNICAWDCLKICVAYDMVRHLSFLNMFIGDGKQNLLQATETSWPWPQLLLPHPAKRQLDISVSLPSHCKSSIKIEDVPVPKWAPENTCTDLQNKWYVYLVSLSCQYYLQLYITVANQIPPTPHICRNKMKNNLYYTVGLVQKYNTNKGQNWCS